MLGPHGRIPGPPDSPADRVAGVRRTATSTTAPTSTPTTAPATSSSSPASATTPTSASRTRSCSSGAATTQTAVHLSRRHRPGPAQPERLRLPRRGHRAAAQAAHRPRRNRGHRRRSHLERAVRRRPGAAAHPARGQPGHAGRAAVRPAGFSWSGQLVDRRRGDHRRPVGAGSAAATGPGASGRSARPSPPGRPADPPFEGMWWLYVPMAFDDFAIVLIIQEEPSGFRSLNDCTRIWKDGRVEQLGWPRVKIHYRSGTRIPTGATIDATAADGTPGALRRGVQAAGADPRRRRLRRRLGLDPRHVEGREVHRAADLRHDRPGDHRAGRLRRHRPRRPRGVHATATATPVEGWGLFEHGALGRHDPSGFADWLDRRALSDFRAHLPAREMQTAAADACSRRPEIRVRIARSPLATVGGRDFNFRDEL